MLDKYPKLCSWSKCSPKLWHLPVHVCKILTHWQKSDSNWKIISTGPFKTDSLSLQCHFGLLCLSEWGRPFKTDSLSLNCHFGLFYMFEWGRPFKTDPLALSLQCHFGLFSLFEWGWPRAQVVMEKRSFCWVLARSFIHDSTVNCRMILLDVTIRWNNEI